MRWLICFTALMASLLPGATIRTVIGTGQPGADERSVNNPYGLVIGPDGALYFCDIDNHVVRRLDLRSGKTAVVAGSGKKGNSGDGGPATQADLDQPYELRFDRAGNLFFVDMPNHVVRRVDKRTGRISKVAGTGAAGFSGDAGPAVQAELRQPHSVMFDTDGSLLICDIGNHRVRRVHLPSGRIDTILGTGERKPTPDGAGIVGTPFNGPRAIEVDKEGNWYLALREGNAIYRIHRKTGTVRHIAGNGKKGWTGDGGPAAQATLNGPKGLALSPDGRSLFVADTENHVIRRIDLKTGSITTIAGTGERGDGPDGDPLRCKLNRPHGVFVDKQERVWIGDSEAHRIRAVERLE